MVLKQSLASEGTFSVVNKVRAVEKLFPEKSHELKKKIHFLPKEIIDEMSEFTKRNSLVVFATYLDKKELCHKCCERCLKAHIIKKCREISLGKKIHEIINEVMPCESGHGGYYVDENELVVA